MPTTRTHKHVHREAKLNVRRRELDAGLVESLDNDSGPSVTYHRAPLIAMKESINTERDMLSQLSGQDSPRQDAISATSKAHRTAFQQKTLASGAMPRRAAASTPETHSSKDIYINFSIAIGNGVCEAGAPAMLRTQKQMTEFCEVAG